MKNLIVLISLVAFSCSSTKELSRQEAALDLNLNGIWVGDYNDDLQFVLYVEETPTSLGLNIMGKNVIPMNYKKKGDQAWIKFRNTRNQIFHLMAQIDEQGEMKLSITQDTVSDFMPIGQLGEKVFQLNKVEHKAELIVDLSMRTQAVEFE